PVPAEPVGGTSFEPTSLATNRRFCACEADTNRHGAPMKARSSEAHLIAVARREQFMSRPPDGAMAALQRVEKVAIPEQYSNPTAPLSVAPNQVIDAFVSANDELSPEGITLDCDHRRLREVRICFTRDLKFRDCSPGAQRVCRSERMIMPPVRGR